MSEKPQLQYYTYDKSIQQIKSIDTILEYDEIEKIMLRLSDSDNYEKAFKFFSEDTILAVIKESDEILHFIILSYHPTFKVYQLEVWSFRRDK